MSFFGDECQEYGVARPEDAPTRRIEERWVTDYAGSFGRGALTFRFRGRAMTTMDPHSATLAVLTTAAQLAILLFLYRDNRERFLGWAIAAWCLRAGYFVVQLGPLLAGPPRVWAQIAAVASAANGMALLGSAVAYRSARGPSARQAAVVVAMAVAAAALILPGGPERLGFHLAVFETLVLVGAAHGFWLHAGVRVRGTGVLAATLLAWAAVRLGFRLPLPSDVRAGLVPVATVLQVLQMIAIVVVVLDAARSRLLDSERLATIGRLASRVAHEIRNPLGVMAIHADLAAGELHTDGNLTEAADHLAIVRSEIRGVAQLIETYLRFGRIPRLEVEPVDVDALVDGELKAFEAELGLRRIGVRRTSGGRLPRTAADPEQLGQIVVNLVRNAIEAMPDGGELSIRTGAQGGHLEVEVADTGPGVRSEDAERIFLPFETTKRHGIGLGLAVAREIAQAHGGTLRCRPAEGGARLVLTLPIRDETGQG